ncbi:MAG TPA: trehalose-phosphatase, partial [Thermoanaerobaculia bacterium]|nr:trehalose-phosphatase [Thermoanaerobaculia bacterium]
APFDGGLELRPRGFHKGLVVQRAFAEFGTDAAVAYLGDDATDEDAFAALRGRGLPVLVRGAPRRTRADARLRPPDEVLEFLEAWAGACRAAA